MSVGGGVGAAPELSPAALDCLDALLSDGLRTDRAPPHAAGHDAPATGAQTDEETVRRLRQHVGAAAEARRPRRVPRACPSS